MEIVQQKVKLSQNTPFSWNQGQQKKDCGDRGNSLPTSNLPVVEPSGRVLWRLTFPLRRWVLTGSNEQSQGGGRLSFADRSKSIIVCC